MMRPRRMEIVMAILGIVRTVSKIRRFASSVALIVLSLSAFAGGISDRDRVFCTTSVSGAEPYDVSHDEIATIVESLIVEFEVEVVVCIERHLEDNRREIAQTSFGVPSEERTQQDSVDLVYIGAFSIIFQERMIDTQWQFDEDQGIRMERVPSHGTIDELLTYISYNILQSSPNELRFRIVTES